MFFCFILFFLCQGDWTYYLENGQTKISHFLSMRQRYTEVGIAQELQRSSCKLFPVSCHLSLNPDIKDLEKSYGTNKFILSLVRTLGPTPSIGRWVSSLLDHLWNMLTQGTKRNHCWDCSNAFSWSLWGWKSRVLIRITS